ncbi:MAG TPA: hypothetical protein VHS06_02345, partial [Chloroflexota bacterium]|nr:hypothetical protein [Chloroflexota bacterium]
GDRSVQDLKLVFASSSSDEKIEFDLGTLSQSTSITAGAGAAGLKTVDASVLPAELKSIPMPPGFGVVDGSPSRSASGGAFQRAIAKLFGKMSIKDLAQFYGTALAKEWEANNVDSDTGHLQGEFVNKKDGNLILYINAEQSDKGTTVDIMVEKN